MIREFEKGDEERLKPNEHSDMSAISDVFEDDSFIKHTLEDEGDVKCILCWKQYLPRHYAIFFLMPDGVAFKHARALKKFLDNATLNMNPKSCLTYSFDCDMLNRWHKFFGFKMQRKSLLEAAAGFNKWMIKWA